MAGTKRALLSVLVVSTCIITDQSTKALAGGLLEPQTTVELVGRMIRFEYTENRGAFLSVGWQLPEEVRFWAFTVMTGLLLVIVLLFALLKPGLSLASVVALSGIAGGGISNIIDRLLHGGAVIDFIGLNTVIVNLADIAITAGIALAVISWLRLSRLGAVYNRWTNR
jgi:signal peptidase II